MSRTTKVTAAIGLTINVGNYNSIRIDMGAEAFVEPGEDAEAVQRDLFGRMRAQVEQSVGLARETMSAARPVMKG